MKKIITSVTFLLLLSCTVMAANDTEHNGDDPEKTKKESQYSFSLSKSWFSLFNLFSVEEQKGDTILLGDSDLKLLVNPPQ